MPTQMGQTSARRGIENSRPKLQAASPAESTSFQSGTIRAPGSSGSATWLSDRPSSRPVQMAASRVLA